MLDDVPKQSTEKQGSEELGLYCVVQIEEVIDKASWCRVRRVSRVGTEQVELTSTAKKGKESGTLLIRRVGDGCSPEKNSSGAAPSARPGQTSPRQGVLCRDNSPSLLGIQLTGLVDVAS